MSEAEELFEHLWRRFGREVSVSYVGDTPDYPWSVMVEDDVGSFGGETLVDAFKHHIEGEAPERTSGWGVDAR